MPIFSRQGFVAWAPVFDRIVARLRTWAPSFPTRSVTIEVAPGELIDKIIILQIKAERISDPDSLRSVRTELEVLRAARDRTISPSAELRALTVELTAVNEALWRIEDEIRGCERAGDFGPKFIELARSVYKNNDHRAALKRRINERLGSAIVEQKSYTASTPTSQPPFGV